jgi:hypothetical protein
MRKWIFAVALALSLSTAAVGVAPASAQERAQTAIHLFGSSECPLCLEAITYLRSVAEREGAVVYWHPAKDSARESALMRAVAGELGVAASGYPYIVVGRRAHVGWKGSTTGLQLTNELAQVRETGEDDVVATLETSMDDKLRSGETAGPPRLGIGMVGLGAIAVIVLAAATVAVVIKRKP